MAQSPEELKRGIEQTRRNLSRDVDAINEKVSPTRVVGRRVERIRGTLSGLKEKVMGNASDTTSTIGGTASSAADAVADAVTSSPAAARRQVKGNPLAAGLVAFGAGWIIASLLPASETEARVAHDLRDTAAGPVKEHAAQAVHEMKDNLRADLDVQPATGTTPGQ